MDAHSFTDSGFSDSWTWQEDPLNDQEVQLHGDFDLEALRAHRDTLARRMGVKATRKAIANRNRERGGISVKILKIETKLKNFRRRKHDLNRLKTYDDELAGLDVQLDETARRARQNNISDDDEGDDDGEQVEGIPQLEPVAVPGGIPPATV